MWMSRKQSRDEITLFDVSRCSPSSRISPWCMTTWWRQTRRCRRGLTDVVKMASNCQLSLECYFAAILLSFLLWISTSISLLKEIVLVLTPLKKAKAFIDGSFYGYIFKERTFVEVVWNISGDHHWAIDSHYLAVIVFVGYLPLADKWTYTHTIRCPMIHRESPELKMQVTSRKYEVSGASWLLVLFVLLHGDYNCLQCFDAVSWVAGRAFGL